MKWAGPVVEAALAVDPRRADYASCITRRYLMSMLLR